MGAEVGIEQDRGGKRHAGHRRRHPANCTTINATIALNAGTSRNGINRRGLRMIGKPNNNTSLTLNNDNGKLATASKRMDWLLENSRIANNKHKVAPEPPIKAKLPSKPLLSRYSTSSPSPTLRH